MSLLKASEHAFANSNHLGGRDGGRDRRRREPSRSIGRIRASSGRTPDPSRSPSGRPRPLPRPSRSARPPRSPRPPPPAARRRAPPAPDKPAFDVVSVEPTGEAVVAGRAAPNAKVELKDAGKTVAEATANAEGQFVMIPPPLPPGEHSLALSTGAGASAADLQRRQRSPSRRRDRRRRPQRAVFRAALRPLRRPWPSRCVRPRPPAPGPGEPGRRPVDRSEPRAAAWSPRARRSRTPLVRLYLSGAYRRRRQDRGRRPMVADDRARHDARRLRKCAPTRSIRPTRRSPRGPRRRSTIRRRRPRRRAQPPVRRPRRSRRPLRRPTSSSIRSRRIMSSPATRSGASARNSMATARATRSSSPPIQARSATRNLIYPGQVFVVPKPSRSPRSVDASLCRPRPRQGRNVAQCLPTIPPTFSPSSPSRLRRRARPAHHRDAHLGGARGTARGASPTTCSTAIASASSSMERRFGGRMRRWRRCIRNGAGTATPGGATSTPSSRSNIPTADEDAAIFVNEPALRPDRASPRGRSEPFDAPAHRSRAGRARFSRCWKSSSPWARRTTSPISTSMAEAGKRRPLAGDGDRLFVRDRPQGRLQRRRRDPHRCDPARAFAGDEGACRPRHRLGTARDLSRRRRGSARPCRRGPAAVRSKRSRRASSGMPTSAASPRSATPRPAPPSSTCSTTSSKF